MVQALFPGTLGNIPLLKDQYDPATDRTPAERLRRARLARYPSGAGFAAAIGVPQSTYQAHESGERGLNAKAAKKYAEHLDVEPLWLLHGSPGAAWFRSWADEANRSITASVLTSNPDAFCHILLNAQGGEHELGRVLGRWLIPKQLIAWAGDVPRDDLLIVQMDSDDMEPTMKRGDPVIIDMTADTVTASGIYLLKNEVGHFFRRVEPLLDTDTAQVRLSCDNTRYQPYTAKLDQISVRARALGLVPIQRF
jgi:transcriptional regulator with XRE-family HTH domain